MRRVNSALYLMISALLIASFFGCAFGEIRPNDPFKHEFSLEEMQKDYSDQVRWSKFAEAGKYMKDADRTTFLARMPEFEEVRFTSWEADPMILDEELRNTTVEVRYSGYSLSSPFETKVHETQVWTREGKGNNWTVVSEFHDLDKLAGN